MSFKIFAVLTLSSLLTSAAVAQSTFVTTLNGLNETPIVISKGTGHVRITISEDRKSIEYELSYSGLEGSKVQGGSVLFAHIHIGRPTIAGGVAVFFCGGGNTAATKAPCPESGTVTGTWTAADVVGPQPQGVDPTDTTQNAFERVVKSILAGLSYANVHTTRSPGGEIRGQLFPARE
jgi:CHRD domain